MIKPIEKKYMNDYLEIYEKFKDVKEIFDLCDDVQKLREYYRTRQFQKMQEHIRALTIKYSLETLVWNTVNTQPPLTCEQAYINAENFLCRQGAKLVVEKISGYKSRLSPDEISFIESMIKPME